MRAAAPRACVAWRATLGAGHARRMAPAMAAYPGALPAGLARD